MKVQNVLQYGFNFQKVLNVCGDSREQNIQWVFVPFRLEWNVEARSIKQAPVDFRQ